MAEWDLNALMQAEFQHREADVPVPELADFVAGDDSEPAWRVRGLSAGELFQAAEAQGRDEKIQAAMKALASGSGGDETAACAAFGIQSLSELPDAVRKRLEMVYLGLVSPSLDAAHRDVVIQVAEHQPQVFMRLANEIDRLTNQGSELVGKPKPSGQTKASA